MKKSQILAALALAFALGVVAPVASTYAYVGGNAAGNMTAEQGAQISRELNAAITNGQSVKNYTEYDNLVDWVDIYDDAFKSVITAQTTALRNALLDVNKDYAAGTNTNGDVTTLYKTVVTANNSANNAWQLLTNSIAEKNTNTPGGYTATPAETAELNRLGNIVRVLSAAITAANSAFDGAWDGTLPNFDGAISKISEEAVEGLKTSDAYKTAVAAGKNTEVLGMWIKLAKSLPKFNDAKTLIEAIEEGQTVLKAGEYHSYEEAQAALNAINKAIAAFNGSTTPSVGDGANKPEEGGNKAPNTGILADAEGNASTTVAMVAGIATALTAAGAGVVAYRNARRSTRK